MKKVISNLLVAFLSQGISLVMSLLLSLLLPKFLGVNQYSYSQLFIFYVGYVGFFHFGINDGIYLRLGGQDYNRLNNRRIATEFKTFIIVEIIIAILLGGIGALIFDDYNRKLIFLLATVYMVLNNTTLYLGYVFQAVNETKWFSYSVMVDRIAVITFIVLLVLFRQNTYIPFIIVYTISKGIALGYCLWKGKEIVFERIGDIITSIKDLWMDASAGIKLMISNIVAMLILGVGRMIIDNIWGIESFGKISLSFSFTNFFLVFIQQISMVLFPVLRKIGDNHQKEIFVLLRNVVNLIAPCVLVLYFPLQYILGLWLPAYSESLVYLAYLLPLCIFDGKMQMLFNTYFKVLRQEKRLMNINIISFLVSFILCICGGFVVKSMTAVVAAMVFAIIIRSIVSDYLLSRHFGTRMGMEYIYELLIIVAYYSIVILLSPLHAFFTVLCVYVAYLVINRKEIEELYRSFRLSKVS